MTLRRSVAAAFALFAAGLLAGATVVAVADRTPAATAAPAQLRTVSASVDAVEQLDDTAGQYVDLPTVGPSVTATVGSSRRVLVVLSAHLSGGTSLAGMGFEVTAADGTVVPASDVRALRMTSGTRGTFSVLVEGLTPGPATVTARYRSAGSGEQALVAGYRNLTVIPL